jgi:hypothetical protein
VTRDRVNYEVFQVAAMDETKLQEAFNHPSLTSVGFVHPGLNQVLMSQSNGRTYEDDLSSDEDEDYSSSPPVLWPRREVLSVEEYDSVNYIVSAYASVSLRYLDCASAYLLSPMPISSTPVEILAMLDDDFVPEDENPLVFSIVPEDSSIQALSADFQDLPTSSGPYTVPQVPVHSAHAHQHPMSISNALPYIQLQLGTQDS